MKIVFVGGSHDGEWGEYDEAEIAESGVRLVKKKEGKSFSVPAPEIEHYTLRPWFEKHPELHLNLHAHILVPVQMSNQDAYELIQADVDRYNHPSDELSAKIAESATEESENPPEPSKESLEAEMERKASEVDRSAYIDKLVPLTEEERKRYGMEEPFPKLTDEFYFEKLIQDPEEVRPSPPETDEGAEIDARLQKMREQLDMITRTFLLPEVQEPRTLSDLYERYVSAVESLEGVFDVTRMNNRIDFRVHVGSGFKINHYYLIIRGERATEFDVWIDHPSGAHFLDPYMAGKVLDEILKLTQPKVSE